MPLRVVAAANEDWESLKPTITNRPSVHTGLALIADYVGNIWCCSAFEAKCYQLYSELLPFWC
jgi:hypothetical protein